MWINFVEKWITSKGQTSTTTADIRSSNKTQFHSSKTVPDNIFCWGFCAKYHMKLILRNLFFFALVSKLFFRSYTFKVIFSKLSFVRNSSKLFIFKSLSVRSFSTSRKSRSKYEKIAYTVSAQRLVFVRTFSLQKGKRK